jgi:iron complex outermembrane receptor protein
LPTDLPKDYHFYEYRGAKNILSVYASESYNLSKDINILGSVQLVNQKYRFYDEKPFYIDSTSSSSHSGWTNYEFEVPFTFVNPRLGLNFSITEELRSYVSFSYTSREPRLTDYYNATFFTEPNFQPTEKATYDFSNPLIRPEKLFDYELGLTSQSKLSEETLLKYKIGGYYMPFIDELIKTGETDRFGSSIVGNAESVLHYGVELSAEFAYSELLALSANLTISHNEIREFSSYIEPDTIVGKTPIGFPSIVANIGVVYQPIEQISLTVTGHYQGASYGDLINSDIYRNDAYFVVNSGAAFNLNDLFGQGHLVLRLQVQNLFDTLYTSYVESGLGFFVAAPRHLFGSLEIGL